MGRGISIFCHLGFHGPGDWCAQGIVSALQIGNGVVAEAIWTITETFDVQLAGSDNPMVRSQHQLYYAEFQMVC